MNVIVSNKQKIKLDNANIDAIKDLNGLFNVSDLINNFKNYFFSKMIIDATSIVDFAKTDVLKTLVDGIGAEKLLILLPEKPPAPKRFLALLVNLGIYNFSSNIDDIVNYLQNPNTYDDVKKYIDDENVTYNASLDNQNVGINNMTYNNINSNINTSTNQNTNQAYNQGYVGNNVGKFDDKYILGIRNITLHAGTTSLIYMLKQALEYRFNKKVLAFEVNTRDFVYFKNENMISVTNSNLESTIKNNNCDVILIDLNNNNYESICNDVLYLIEPSIISVNRLITENRMIFLSLCDKKVVLNKSLISNHDTKVFEKEAGIHFFFNIPPLNDRVGNSIIENLIMKLRIDK